MRDPDINRCPVCRNQQFCIEQAEAELARLAKILAATNSDEPSGSHQARSRADLIRKVSRQRADLAESRDLLVIHQREHTNKRRR